uniref:MYM-type domain-containing protein n=1 Tax=viral metagenome TaxID=1070528 RepID=A0A6C0LT39_9ZZZZ
MSGKIDILNNNDNKSTIISNNMKKTNSGSKVIPKKRGRRPKKIIENDNEQVRKEITETNTLHNEPAMIVRLNINPSKLKLKTTSSEIKNNESNKSNNEDDLSDGMFKNDIPKDTICNKCTRNEKIIMELRKKLEKYERQNKTDKIYKIYINKLNIISAKGKKVSIEKTHLKCWWDCHPFDHLPCFLPELFHNETYHVRGCFCSFNCALAYNLYFLKDSKIHMRKTLVFKMYKEMHNLKYDNIVSIKEAPPREILEDFSEDGISIEEFRKSFTIPKNYIVFTPPIKPIHSIVEEHNINNTDENKEYVLERSKPLSKKGSIISSMKIDIDDD